MERSALIVDDDPHTLFFLEQALQPLSVKIVRAEDGDQALSVLQQQTPNMLFLDLLLPGASGLDILHFIGQTPRLSDMQVIIISAHSEYRDNPETSHVNAYLLKPFRVKDIREVAQQALLQI